MGCFYRVLAEEHQMKFSQFQRKVGQGWFSEEARIILQEEELRVEVVCKRRWVKHLWG